MEDLIIDDIQRLAGNCADEIIKKIRINLTSHQRKRMIFWIKGAIEKKEDPIEMAKNICKHVQIIADVSLIAWTYEELINKK